MQDFSLDLLNYLKSKTIQNCIFFSEKSKTPQNITENIVLISSISETPNFGNRRKQTFSKRFTISGDIDGCMNKAIELFNLFIPDDENLDTKFQTENFIVFDVQYTSVPRLINNSGNIYFSSFSLSFLVAIK